ncbi:hypothetical protein J1605_013358 [Eschrichtius robustus]|uniref:Uncharacterized protein n=1 Tax=Eschrichtius robustus TaxID=9764 RepID=A0AB34GGB6_ESCRO|nr:hypothetical protein J1605_013358 [Eschrichtius robustus]
MAISHAGNGNGGGGGGGTPSTRAGRETRHDNPGRDSGPWVPGHSGVRSGLRARRKQGIRADELPIVLVFLVSAAKTPDAPGADLRGSPESSKCPRGWGRATSAALSARAAQRGSTTFVSASLHRALTLASLFQPFPSSALTQGRGRARTSRSEKAQDSRSDGASVVPVACVQRAAAALDLRRGRTACLLTGHGESKNLKTQE